MDLTSSVSSRRHLLPLLPGSKAAALEPAPAQNRRKSTVSAACETCRRKKIKCDGERPCSGCDRRGQDCVYNTRSDSETHNQALKRKFSELQDRNAALKQLHELLRDGSDKEALAILEIIRKGEEPEAILRQVNHGDLLLQLRLVPESKYRYEFPYRGSMPAYLEKIQSQYLQSVLFEAPYTSTGTTLGEGRDKSPMSHLQDPYVKPFHSVRMIDPLLNDANISAWTAIKTSESFLHSLMEAYFLHKHPIFVHFHKDLFLRDLKAHRHRFCSRLLVHAVLAAACHAAPDLPRRSEYWNPNNIGYLFQAEAKRLLELEVGKDKITTIQALLVLNLNINEQGMDQISYPYHVQAIEMAQRMGLFSPSTKSQSKDWGVAYDYTAWSMFSWQSITAYSKKEPVLLLKPPVAPLPEPDLNPSWYSEILVRYPSGQVAVSTLHPQTYHAQLKFHVILNDIAIANTTNVSGDGMSLHQASRFYARVLAWFDELPRQLQPDKATFPFQLALHMQYWATIMSLFEGLNNVDMNRALLQGRTLLEIKTEARLQLELIIRIYYLRNGFETYNPWVFYFLTTLGFLLIQEVKDGDENTDVEATRSTLILVAKGISNQGKCYYLAEAMLRVICKVMQPSDVIILKQYASFEDIDNPKIAAERLRLIRTNWPLQVGTPEDPERKQQWNTIYGEESDASGTGKSVTSIETENEKDVEDVSTETGSDGEV